MQHIICTQLLINFYLSNLWERIIVDICRQCPFEDRWPKFESANVWMVKHRQVQTLAIAIAIAVMPVFEWSNISTFKHRHYNYGNSYSNSYADVWTCRCLNMPMCTIIPIRSPIITSISLDCLQQINLPMTLFNSILCPI